MYSTNTHTSISVFQLRVVVILLLLLAAFAIAVRQFGSVSSKDQATLQHTANLATSSLKVLQNKIPRQLPIRVKVKNLNSKRWSHDLEVEVTNTADKPIYYLDFQVILPEIKSSSGLNIGFPLRYGRIDFVKFTTPVRSSDVPIRPKNTHTFKIAEASAKGWDYLKEHENKPEPKKIQLIFKALNFGDGTGYADAGGTPIEIHRKVAEKEYVLPSNNSFSASTLAFIFLTANFVPAKFSTSEIFKSILSKPLAQPDINCPGTTCSFVKYGTYVCSRLCDPDNPEHPSAVFTGSGDPEGACRVIGSTDNVCYTDTGIDLHCTDTQLYSCAQFGGSENTDSKCDDTIDNDGDGSIDCSDSDCSSTSICNSGPSSCPSTDCNEGGNGFANDPCMYPGSGCPYNYSGSPCCQPYNPSPILVDVDGSGFQLTSAGEGVWFDFFDSGAAINIAWTTRDSTNAWLVLDRDGNGFIDNGKELFGDVTPQPATANPHGFLALAEYDKPANGGNSDGLITQRDAIFDNLRLWQDKNHNGNSEAAELHTLPNLGLKAIDLDYKESKRTDQYGNQFRYRAKLKDTKSTQLGRWAWDVFLVAGQ